MNEVKLNGNANLKQEVSTDVLLSPKSAKKEDATKVSTRNKLNRFYKTIKDCKKQMEKRMKKNINLHLNNISTMQYLQHVTDGCNKKVTPSNLLPIEERKLQMAKWQENKELERFESVDKLEGLLMVYESRMIPFFSRFQIWTKRKKASLLELWRWLRDNEHHFKYRDVVNQAGELLGETNESKVLKALRNIAKLIVDMKRRWIDFNTKYDNGCYDSEIEVIDDNFINKLAFHTNFDANKIKLVARLNEFLRDTKYQKHDILISPKSFRMKSLEL